MNITNFPSLKYFINNEDKMTIKNHIKQSDRFRKFCKYVKKEEKKMQWTWEKTLKPMSTIIHCIIFLFIKTSIYPCRRVPNFATKNHTAYSAIFKKMQLDLNTSISNLNTNIYLFYVSWKEKNAYKYLLIIGEKNGITLKIIPIKSKCLCIFIIVSAYYNYIKKLCICYIFTL